MCDGTVGERAGTGEVSYGQLGHPSCSLNLLLTSDFQNLQFSSNNVLQSYTSLDDHSDQLTTLCHQDKDKKSNTGKPDFYKIGFDGDTLLLTNI